MEANPDLIEVVPDLGGCSRRRGRDELVCAYYHGCNYANADERPCKKRNIMFIRKLDYLTWKLTQ